MKQNEIQTQEFASNDRSKSTQNHNEVQSKKFVLYALKCYELPDADPKIKFIQANNYIHKSLLIDTKLAGYLTDQYNDHKAKGNLIEPNLRHSHGYVAYSIDKAGEELDDYPLLKSCWAGIRNTNEYIESSNHEQAVTHSLTDHVKITDVSVYDKKKMYIREVVRSKECYNLNYGAALRSENIHKLNECDVKLDKSGVKPNVIISTNRTKTNKTKQHWVVSCTCSGKHIEYNYSCPITNHVLYQALKKGDYNVYVSNHSDEPSQLPYFRRLRYTDTKKKIANENYFDRQRWGLSHIRNNLKWIAEYIGITPPKTDNKRRVTFSC